jgi:hypothetical protein
MRSIMTDTPPTIREVDGKWFICVVGEDVEMWAPVGAWFASQFVTRVIIPKLVLDAQAEHTPVIHSAKVPDNA